MQRKFGIPTTVDDIIETTIVQLAKHELLNGGANITIQQGTEKIPVKVKKYRNFNGVELKESGLTLSVYPYYYEGTSRPTPESQNTSISFKPYGFTGTDPTRPRNAIDIATANIKVRLDYLDYTLRDLDQTSTRIGDPSSIFGSAVQVQQFETNDAESMLRKYLEYVRLILSSNLFNLGGLIQSSFVTWCNFPTTTWDNKGNLILHTAEIMWQVYYYPLRDWRVDQGVRGVDPIIGSLQKDGSPVFYVVKHNALVTGTGVVILNTPTGIPINWDTTNKVLVNATNKEPLSAEALKDPSSGNSFIRLDILPIGVLQNGDIPVYFNSVSKVIIKYNGEVISKIPGPRAKLKSDFSLDTSPEAVTNWIPVSWSEVNKKLVYGAGHPSQGQAVSKEDLVDPSTKQFYIITEDVVTSVTSSSNSTSSQSLNSSNNSTNTNSSVNTFFQPGQIREFMEFRVGV